MSRAARMGFVLCLLALSGLVIQASDYFICSWQVEDGLPQNSVTAIIQTHDGYLWVGTYSGLARFDGVRFTAFDENNSPELHNSRVTSLFEAADGTIWIGHENGEVTGYKDGVFHAINYSAAWSGGKIIDIGSDESGDIWIFNEEGLAARVKDGMVLTPPPGSATKLVNVARSQSGHFWVSRDGRVSELVKGQFRALEFSEAASNNYVLGIGASSDGGLWIAGDNRVRKWKDGNWVEGIESAWVGTPITRLIELRNGTLAAGTSDHGLHFIFPHGREETTVFNRAVGFPSDWIVSQREDREGNLWVGTGGGGLVMMHRNTVQTIGPSDQWQGRPVLTAKATRDGALWAGTEGAGLYQFKGGAWTHFGPDEGLYNPYVWSIAEDDSGGLWVGTWGSGLFLQQPNGHFGNAPGLVRTSLVMPALYSELPGKLWLGTGEGLMLYESGKTNSFGNENGALRKNVRAVIKDSNGAVWFGMAGGGLGCLSNGVLKQFRNSDGLASDYIECLHPEGDALWIGTSGGGLCRLKQGRFATVGKNQGLPNNVICDIQDDGNENFWMSSHGGIIRASRAQLNLCADGEIKELNCVSYGLSDGMPTLECSEGRGCKTADGRLWFPTTKGLVSLDPNRVAINPLPPPVVIEEMLVDDERVTNELSGPAALTIPAGRHRFEFQYTGLSLVAPKKVQFKYRLEGFETNWVNAGTRRVVDYNYIPPGRYLFQVVACNNDGVWNENGATVNFGVLPFFWQTVWFRVLAWSVIIAVSGGIVWFETRRRMRHKLERMEHQRDIERERARIARDIHDDLGAHLTRITMLSESARAELDGSTETAGELSQIYDTSRELTRSMDEIVWAVNPRHDTMESLSGYLERFAQDLLATAGIRCRLDMPVQFPDWRLTAEVRHNVFLAFKEALHNVVKHAAANEVRIVLTLKKSAFELTVADDGHGFDYRNGTANDPRRISAGNGLGNMSRRLKEVGGLCEIESAPGRGTKVTFAVPLKLAFAVPMS